MRAKIVKNKVAAPFRVAEFDIYYNEGISYLGDIINTAVKYGVIKKSGSWLQFEETKLGQGADGAKIFLRDNPSVAEKIKKEIFDQASKSYIV